jgi:hypothetical protein
VRERWDADGDADLRRRQEREVVSRLPATAFAHARLLSSEATAHHYHRQLAAEHLTAAWGGEWRIRHLQTQHRHAVARGGATAIPTSAEV